MPNSATKNALLRLGILLQLQKHAQAASYAELPFLFVNETHALTPYRQAFFWQFEGKGVWSVGAVSGLAAPDPGAPFVLWLKALAKELEQQGKHTHSTALQASLFSPALAANWQEWLPANGLWLPLMARQKLVGALALFREQPFLPEEQELLEHLCGSYALCLPRKAERPPLSALRAFLSTSRKRMWLGLVLFMLLWVPVRQSVLAPAEVIAMHPVHVRAGLEGVIKQILVEPNQQVQSGTPLVTLEDDQLQTRLVVAQKSMEVATAELQQAQQLSLVDPRSKVRLPMLQGRVEQLAAELALVRSQLERVIIVSPAEGIALIDSPDMWLGRPVSLGQKIMELAKPDAVQLEISLPMGESLPLEQGDQVLFFPNISPHAPLAAVLGYIGYQASEQPTIGLAFTLRANFAPNGPLPRLGLRGTAKLYGARRPLIGLLLRKPLLQVRQWLGM